MDKYVIFIRLKVYCITGYRYTYIKKFILNLSYNYI